MRQLLNSFRAAHPASRPAVRRNQATRPTFELLEARNLMSVEYGGGPLLENIQIETVFYGRTWYNDPVLYKSTGTIDRYFTDIVQSSYMDMLNEYGVGRGDFLRGVINLGNPPRGSVVSDSEIRSMLDTGIHRGYFDAPTPNQLYFVFTPPNVVVTDGSGDSQHDFLGYHWDFYDPDLGTVYYAVIPHPVGNANIWGLNPFQQQTAVSSHELAEAATDADCQTGWQDPTVGVAGEIGDLATGYFALLDGYVVQAEYSNYYGGPVIPWDSIPYFPGGFAAVPGPGQGQRGADGNLSTSLSSPIPASGPSVLSSAMDLSPTSAADISHRAGAERHTDDFFAALAMREKDGEKPGPENQRAEVSSGRDWLTFANRHGKDAADMAGQFASDLAVLDASSL